MILIKGEKVTKKDVIRFYRKVTKIKEGKYKGCYDIAYTKDKDGYPRFSIRYQGVLAHRFIYQIMHPDEDIEYKEICHKCDNPGCVRPDHLFSGSRVDNSIDMVVKDRQAKGSDVGGSKLTAENIDEIINNTLSGYFISYKAIAEHYNVTPNNIRYIINQQTWSHVTKDRDMAKVKLLLNHR